MKSTTYRRGMTLIEVSVSIVLAAILAGLALEAQVMRGSLHRATRWREMAVTEAGNLMERLTARPWDELEPEKLTTVTLSDEFRSAVPKASLQLSVEPATDDPRSRRVSIEIAWPGPTGTTVRPVRLTAWAYRIEGEKSSEAKTDPESKPDDDTPVETKSTSADDTEKTPEAQGKP